MAESLESMRLRETDPRAKRWLDSTSYPTFITASGFAMVPRKDEGLPYSIDALDSVYTAYQDYMAMGSYALTFEFQLKCMEACAKPFGDLRTWATYNVTQIDLTDSAFNFLVETLVYIRTGVRKFYPASYLSQIKHDPTNIPQIDAKTRNARYAKIHDLLEGLDGECISMWCSYDQGFKDLIVTCAIMFGGLQIR